MISPRIDQLLDRVDSNYASVIVAAKRARQINSYYHNCLLYTSDAADE